MSFFGSDTMNETTFRVIRHLDRLKTYQEKGDYLRKFNPNELDGILKQLEEILKEWPTLHKWLEDQKKTEWKFKQVGLEGFV